MAIEPGRTLLHYRLVEKLGEGGMGVVWRAVDATLDREVAIKLLPDALAADPERLARFQREAKLLAAVNHPNIAAVYSVHEHDGTRFLAMELVPGEDLAVRLSRGPLPTGEAVAVARQVADALETAHESGVVHRDLKPANVRLTPEGRVKVLDFGLAKALEPAARAAATSSPSLSPTVTSAGTAVGLLLGTAAYMSPEQARGQAVDRRADIWAFGCLLYELLCGKQAFGGATVSDALAAVLVKEPDWSALPAGLPPGVRRLIARCLDKDPRTRLRDAGEARIALSQPAELDAEREAPARRARRWPERLLWLAVLALVATALVRRGAEPGADIAAAARGAPPAFSLRRLTELPGPERHPSLSPDGRMLIYDSAVGGNSDVYLLRVGGDRAINLTADSPDDDYQARFAPDGDRIGFRSERDGGGLFVMGATGESVRRATDRGYNPTWSPDGARLAFATEVVTNPYVRAGVSELWTVELSSGSASRLTETDAVQPTWSPTGERIAYWANTGGQRDIWTVAASGGEPVPVTQDLPTDWSPAWSPDGRWLYFSSDRGGSMSLWRVPLDPATGLTQGGPQPVVPGPRGIAQAGFSADGRRMAVMAYDRTFDVALYAVDESPAVRPLATLRRQSSGDCRPSPDGTWLACSTSGAQEDIVVQRADGSELRRLMDDPHKDRMPIWSPDGESISFRSTRSGNWEQWQIRADGSGLRRLTEFGDLGGRGVYSPDGRRLALNDEAQATFVVDVDRTSTPESATPLSIPLPEARLRFMPGAWSPDGTRLAGSLYDRTRFGRPVSQYAIFDFAPRTLRTLDIEPEGGPMVSIGGWFPDSRRLVVRSATGPVVYDTATDAWRPLEGAQQKGSPSLSANGKVLLIEETVLDSEIWLLTFD